MRRIRSISDYLSLGTLKPEPTPAGETPGQRLGATMNKLARDALFANYPRAEFKQGPRPFERRDVLAAERVTVKLIREAAAQLAEDGVPPCDHERTLSGYIDPEDGGLVFIKRGGDIPAGAEEVWHEPLPGAAEFGPHYQVHLPPQDMTALLADPEYLAGEAAGEFRVGGKGVVMVRPPMVAVDDTIDPATGKVVRRERNAIRLEEV